MGEIAQLIIEQFLMILQFLTSRDRGWGWGWGRCAAPDEAAGVTRLIRIRDICLPVLMAAALLLSGSGAAAADTLGDDAEPYRGDGTPEDPYTYLIHEDTRLTWKRLNQIKDERVTECYEFREGGEVSGKLLYSWLFEPEGMTVAEGPYFLGIRVYGTDQTAGLPFGGGAYFFSFATKRNFPGRVKIRLWADGEFADGDRLYLYYYGGYDATILHGGAPAVSAKEILETEGSPEEMGADIPAEGGYAEFYVRHGGNYFLSREKNTYLAEANTYAVEHYAPETVMGTAAALFPTPGIAAAVAASVGKEPDQALTQGDLDGVSRLYLADLGLTDTEELERVYFARLESLTLSGNRITEAGDLAMPSLTYLDLSHNELRMINAVVRLKTIRHLILTGNQIANMPDLSGMTALQTLELGGNALTVFPPLMSDELRYLDLSGNHIVKLPDLSGCAVLEEVSLLGQTVETSAELSFGESYVLNPAPELLFGLSDGGTAVITDAGGGTVYEKTLSDLKNSGGRIDTAELPRSGAYTLTVTGRQGDEVLGICVYQLILSGGFPAVRAGAWAAAAVILCVTFRRLFLYLKTQPETRR
jgi:internalin A